MISSGSTLELGYIVVAIYDRLCSNSVAYNAAIPNVAADVSLVLELQFLL